MLALFPSMLACGGPVALVPGTAAPLGKAQAVAAADFDGDGVDELVRVDGGVAAWLDRSVDLGGAVQAVARGDTDGDGREEALLASGADRAAPDAPTRVWRIAADGAEVVWERRRTRNQVTDLEVIQGKIWIVTFADERQVEAGWIEGGALVSRNQAALAAVQLPVDDGVLVGRVYGDMPKSDGDLRLDGRVLPTLRGVRSAAISDLDGDGRDELLVGDGWHYAYGQQAVGRVELLSGADWDEARVIAHFPEEYSARDIAVRDGIVLVTGTRKVHLLTRDALGWAERPVAPVDEVSNAIFVRTPEGLAVAVAGDPAVVVPLVRP